MTAQLHKPGFAELVEAHAREIHAYLWRLLREEAEAEDVLQSAFLRAFRAYGRLPAGANVRAWLYRIAGNEARTQLRRRARGPVELGDEIPDRAAGVESQVELRIQLQQMALAVERLPAKQRESLILRKYQGLSYVEIGEILAVSPEAARANVYQAMRKLSGRFAGAASGEASAAARSWIQARVR